MSFADIVPLRRILARATPHALVNFVRRLEYEYQTVMRTDPTGVSATDDDPALQRYISELQRWRADTLANTGSKGQWKGSVDGGFDSTGVSIVATGSNNPDTIRAIKVAFHKLITKLNGRSPSLVSVPFPTHALFGRPARCTGVVCA